jgi:hypothetical protein
MAIVGRASIAKSQQQQLANIETKRQAALTQLNIKYAASDKVKTSFGYIGIISLSCLYGVIILNDMINLFNFICEDIQGALRERREKNEKKKLIVKDEIEHVSLEIDEETRSDDLEEKLAVFHLRLVEAYANNNLKTYRVGK